MSTSIRKTREEHVVEHRVTICDGCGDNIRVDATSTGFGADISDFQTHMSKRLDFCGARCAATYFLKDATE